VEEEVSRKFDAETRKTCERLVMATAHCHSVHDNLPLVCEYCAQSSESGFGVWKLRCQMRMNMIDNQRVKGYGMYREIVFVKSYILTNKR